MASKEPSAMSKIPKLRSTPCSPRAPPLSPKVHPPPPASKGNPNPILEKSVSNVSNSSRIPQLAKASFQKRTSSSIPSSSIPASKIAPGPSSKIPRRGVTSTGNKARNPLQPNCLDEEVPTPEGICHDDLLDLPSDKGHGDSPTPHLGQSEQLAPSKKSQSGIREELQIQDPFVRLIQASPDLNNALPETPKSSRSSSILEEEVTSESRQPVEDMEIPDPIIQLQAEMFFGEVVKSAAQKSLEVSPQHVQRDLLSASQPRDWNSKSSVPSLIGNQCFKWNITEEGNYTDTIEVLRAPKSQTGTAAESHEDFGKISSATADPCEDSHAQNEIGRLHSQEFPQVETRTSASLGDRETLEGHRYPFSYDTSFQLRKASDEPTVEDIPNPLQDDEQSEMMPAEDCEDTCETDYSFYGEEEEDMGDTESEVEQDGDNDELILSTMIHSIANDGQGSNRKTKTIFSVDTPAFTQKDNGPGVNGDGLEAHHHQHHPYSSIRIVSSSTTRDKKEVEVLYRKQEESHPPLEEEADVDIDVDGTVQQEKCPRIRAVNGCIEILPELEPDAEARRCSSTGMEKSRKFSLILLRSSGEFEKSLEISNLTRVSYGFKVWCNSTAYSHLDINPSLGLLLPGRQSTVEIKMSSLEPGLRSDMDKDRIEVRIFRAHNRDPARLQECYEKLLEQRPDLISTQSVDRLILWDADDISGRLELFKSITDEEEQSELKEELHNIQLGEFPSKTMTALPLANSPTAKESLLRHIKEQLRISDFNIKETLKEMAHIRNIQHGIFLLIFLYFAGSLLLPKEDLAHPVPVEQPDPPSIWASLLNKLGFN